MKKVKEIEASKPAKSQVSLLIQILVGLSAVVATILFGIIISIFSLWLSARLIEKPGGEYLSNDAAKLAFLFAIICGVIIYVVFRIIWKRRRNLFLKAVAPLLLCGLGLVVIIGIAAAVGLNNSQINSSDGACTSLQKQYAVAIRATMPIATNLGSGTAFAIDGAGHYLTAYHVVDGATEVYLNLTTGRQPLLVERTAPSYDLAILKGPVQSNYLNLTTSFSQTDEVYAMGYPGNAFTAGGVSVSRGIISRVLSNEQLKLTTGNIPSGMELVQTDAAVNPGNSGGPLIGKCGVIGVVSAMSDRNKLGEYGFVSEQGISYAVSARTIGLQFTLPVVTN